MATLIEDLKTFTPKNDEEAADYALLLEAAHCEEAYNRHGRRTLPHQPGS